MGIVLTVMGKILIVLLELLGILVLTVLLLLFFPVSYKIYGEYKEEKPCVKGRVMWLFGVIYCPFGYDGKKISWKIRFLGIDVQKCMEKWRHRNRRKEKVVKEKKGTMDTTPNHTKTVEKKEVEKVSDAIPDEKTHAVEQGEKKAKKKKTQKKREKKKKGIFEWLKTIASLNGRRALKKCFCSTKDFVCILKDNVIHLWGKLKPRVVRGYVEFGTGDPCTTGQILGAGAFFYGYYGKGITVIPDFEEKKLQGELLIKGRLQLITLLIIVVRLLRCKELQIMRRDFARIRQM